MTLVFSSTCRCRVGKFFQTPRRQKTSHCQVQTRPEDGRLLLLLRAIILGGKQDLLWLQEKENFLKFLLECCIFLFLRDLGFIPVNKHLLNLKGHVSKPLLVVAERGKEYYCYYYCFVYLIYSHCYSIFVSFPFMPCSVLAAAESCIFCNVPLSNFWLLLWWGEDVSTNLPCPQGFCLSHPSQWLVPASACYTDLPKQ